MMIILNNGFNELHELEMTIRKGITLLAVACVSLLFIACNDYETYGEKKDKERAAIRSFIDEQGINVISESEFHDKGNVTDTTNNEYVYLDNNGVYMQVVHKGFGTPLQNGEHVTLAMRFMEMCIMDSTVLYNNTLPYDPDYMIVERTGNTYTALFTTTGLMYEAYGTTSVPVGLLAPFPYINVGRETDENGHIAMVRLIVPHSKGHSYASSYVYPYYYEISYQRTN